MPFLPPLSPTQQWDIYSQAVEGGLWLYLVSARLGRPPSPPLYTQQWEQEVWDDCPLDSEAQRAA